MVTIVVWGFLAVVRFPVAAVRYVSGCFSHEFRWYLCPHCWASVTNNAAHEKLERIGL